jgi:hypothetical protein
MGTEKGMDRPREKWTGSSLAACSWVWGQMGPEYQEAFNDESHLKMDLGLAWRLGQH